MGISVVGRRVLVTGATRGIGQGIAHYLALAGAQLVISGRDAEAGEKLAAKLTADGAPSAAYVEGDLADPLTPCRVVEEAVRAMAGLDAVVNSAGIYPAIPLPELTLADWDRVIRLNLTASMLLLQAAHPHLAGAGNGRFVAVSSITGPRTGFGGLAHYGASKAGLEGFVRSAAVEFAPLGITVNAVAPGSIMTDSLSGLLSADEVDLLRHRIPTGRIGTPDDIAAAVTYLISVDASFVTGHSLVVDGGQTLPEIQ